MSAIFPKEPEFPLANSDVTPACEWVMPVVRPRRSYASTCVVLPPGMPDCLELRVIRFKDGIERTTAVFYGARVYLVHYACEPNDGGGN